ncbi:MAG: DUF1826 domain-containing protein [Pseudomonadota bacterium]
MNDASHSFDTQPPGVHIAEGPDDLGVFCEAHSAATLWPRSIPAQMQSWLDTLDAARLPHGRVVIPAHAVRGQIAQFCDAAGLPKSAGRTWLETDIADVAQRFAALMNTRLLRMRLDVVTTNACRKFHVDAITGRLVCTYRGTGTQYGTSDGSQDPATVFTAQTGAPILLRGTKWPAHPAAGLLHRSPPIEGTGEARLVLVLDPVDPGDDAQI